MVHGVWRQRWPREQAIWNRFFYSVSSVGHGFQQEETKETKRENEEIRFRKIAEHTKKVSATNGQGFDNVEEADADDPPSLNLAHASETTVVIVRNWACPIV